MIVWTSEGGAIHWATAPPEVRYRFSIRVSRSGAVGTYIVKDYVRGDERAGLTLAQARVWAEFRAGEARQHVQTEG